MTIEATTTRDPRADAMVTVFRRDPPLGQCFPLTLSNGNVVPDFTAKCAHCGKPVDPDMVHGRVVDSLPTVKTIFGSAVCKPCQRIIPINGRFRTIGASFQFECSDNSGRWYTVRKQSDANGWRNAVKRLLQSILGKRMNEKIGGNRPAAFTSLPRSAMGAFADGRSPPHPVVRANPRDGCFTAILLKNSLLVDGWKWPGLSLCPAAAEQQLGPAVGPLLRR